MYLVSGISGEPLYAARASASEEWLNASSKLDASASSEFYSTSNPSGFLTAHQSLAGYATEAYVDSSVSSKLDTTAFSTVSGDFLTSHQSLAGYATESYVDSAVSGKLDVTASSQFLTSLPDDLAYTSDVASAVSSKLDASASSEFYPMTSNPSGYLTAHQSLAGYATESYVDSAVSGKLDATAYDSAKFYTTANESGFIDAASASTIASAYAESAASSKLDSSASSSFYPSDNPSGFISGVDLSDYATTAYVDSSVSSKLDSTAQVVSATATQLYAGTAYLTSINEAPVSAARAGNAANASLANSAYYDGTGRLISALPDNATVSAIASSYAESAASSKQDTLTFGYDGDDKISSINGSSLAGEGGGLVTALGTGQNPWYQTSVSSINGMDLSARWADSANSVKNAYSATSASYAKTANYAKTVEPSAVSAYISAVTSPSGTIIVTNKTGIDVTDSAVVGEYVPGYSGVCSYIGDLVPINGYGSAIFTGIPDSLPVNLSLAMGYGSLETVTFSGSNGTTASASYAGSPTALTAYLGKVSSVYIYTQSQYVQQNGLTYTADAIDNASIVPLAHASALPTYQYDAEDKISSINGSAIAGGMDSAACSAIASSYAESAASGKLDATASSSFYPADNPSGFISSVDLSDYATTAYVDSSISGFAYESAVSGWTAKQDALTFGYNASGNISGIDGSALVGGDPEATDLYVQAPLYTGISGGSAYIGWSGYNETVLWSSTATASSFTLSEPLSSFERVKVHGNFNAIRYWADGDISDSTLFTFANMIYAQNVNDRARLQQVGAAYTSTDGLTFTCRDGHNLYWTNTANSVGGGATAAYPGLYKVIGINRTAEE